LGVPHDYATAAPDVTLPATDGTYYIYAELIYASDPTTDIEGNPAVTGVTVDYSDVWPTLAGGVPEPSYKRHLLATVEVANTEAKNLVRRWSGGDIPDFPWVMTLVNAVGAWVLGEGPGAWGLSIQFADWLTNVGHQWTFAVSSTPADHLVIMADQGTGAVVLHPDGSLESAANITANGKFKQGVNEGYTGDVTISGTTLAIHGGIITGVT
jgi:hypothetical protein